MFQGTSVLVTKELLKNELSVESWEKGIKLLFHVNKQLYKKGLLQSTVHLNSCVQYLYKYHEDMLKGNTIGPEIQKVFYMMHQMSYSLFTKEIQKIANKKCNVTEMFLLRTQCLIILTFTDWAENKLVEHVKDFTVRWMKILCNNQYSFNVETIFECLSNLYSFLHNLTGKQADLLPKIEPMMYSVFELTARLAALNTDCYNFYEKCMSPKSLLNTFTKENRANIDFISTTSQVMSTTNSCHTEHHCTCNKTIFDKFILKLDSYIKQKPDIKDFVKYFAWLKSMFLQLKKVNCLELLKFTIQISAKILSSNYLEREAQGACSDTGKLIRSSVYFQVITIFQCVDMKLNENESW